MFKWLSKKIRIFLSTVFKKCTMCTAKWHTRSDFLSDASIAVKGYTANFDHLDLGIFLFDHTVCQTTLAIQANQFVDLYDGPVYETRLTGTEECPGYCLDKNELKTCPAKCECAYVREVLSIVNNFKKTNNLGFSDSQDNETYSPEN